MKLLMQICPHRSIMVLQMHYRDYFYNCNIAKYPSQTVLYRVFFGSAHLIGSLLDESIIWPAQQNQQKKNGSTDIKPSTKMLGTSFAPSNREQQVREKNGRSAIDLWWWRDSLHP
jgi:hypothetical protein